jgi:ABC-2 type transport system permease protein
VSPALACLLLSFILPLAFASYVPAGIFLDNQEYSTLPKWIWRLSILFGLVFFMIAYAFWKKALKHYQSTGS